MLGASGGVGGAAVQLARAMGAHTPLDSMAPVSRGVDLLAQRVAQILSRKIDHGVSAGRKHHRAPFRPRDACEHAPTDPGLLDHRGERLFRALAGFEKRREIAACRSFGMGLA